MNKSGFDYLRIPRTYRIFDEKAEISRFNDSVPQMQKKIAWMNDRAQKYAKYKSQILDKYTPFFIFQDTHTFPEI